jgi:NTE family protein
VKLSRQKIGLALGSGSARGLAHIGVLRVLKEENITIDMIAGTSIGAIVGVLYAIRGNITRIEEVADSMSWTRMLSLVDFTLPKTGVIGGRKIQAWGRTLIGRDIQFSDLKMPFACVATDIMTGQEIVLNEGSVIEAVRASISIPGIFSIVKHEGRYLVDGGLVNPVPVSVLEEMGADFIIAVNVIPNIAAGGKTHWMGTKVKDGYKEPNIIEILMQSIYIGSHALAQTAMKNADSVIEPQVASFGPADFHRAPECMLQGWLAAKECIPELKRKLQLP